MRDSECRSLVDIFDVDPGGGPVTERANNLVSEMSDDDDDALNAEITQALDLMLHQGFAQHRQDRLRPALGEGENPRAGSGGKNDSDERDFFWCCHGCAMIRERYRLSLAR